jgi:hypothetical protein
LQMRVFWSHCRALRINIKRRWVGPFKYKIFP